MAGDEIEGRDFDSMVATGFLHLGIRDDEPTDPPRAIYDDLDGMLDVTCRATLGISMGCARCHDHKKDPLPQRDYYRMVAAFRGMKPYRSGFGNAVRQDNFVRQLEVDFRQPRRHATHAVDRGPRQRSVAMWNGWCTGLCNR